MRSNFQVARCMNNYQWKDSRQRQALNIVLSLCFAVITCVKSDYVNDSSITNQINCDDMQPEEVYFEYSSTVINNGIVHTLYILC